METVAETFKKLIGASNLKGARSILKSFSREPESVQEMILHELALAEDAAAWDLLSFLARLVQSTSPAYPRLVQLIVDRAHPKFQFILILYQMGDTAALREVAPLMKHILVNETDTDILLATIRAAGQHRIDYLVDEISEYLYYDNPELKSGTVRALELIGTAGSLFRLEEASGTIKCDQNILDAIAALGQTVATETPKDQDAETTEEKDLASLFRNLQSEDFTTRFKAIQRITEAGVETGLPDLAENLKSDNHDLILNTLRIIARVIPEKLVGDILDLLVRPGISPAIRFTAYETLGAFPKLESAAAIIPGIDNTALHVRMAAIKALDKHLSDFITADIKNRIETGRSKGELLVETIIDAQTSSLINVLMDSDTFSYIAYNYLSRKAPLSPLSHYIQALQKRGLKSTARKFEDLISSKGYGAKPMAMVISTSRTVHSVYEKILYGGGYGVVTFQSPQNAFEAIIAQKPALVLTDLCFPAMTGLELALEIREFYQKQELPILVSTLQADFNRNSLAHECTAAKINGLAQFPMPLGMIRNFIHG
ncbi:MAG: response regulator [Pseudomonadota bacterium]